jgi:hypothetical protein
MGNGLNTNMKITEIINEDRKGDLPHGTEEHSTSITRFRDNGGYDRANHLNRVMMATACHDGKTKDALSADQMDPASWVEKYNTAHPYTEEEYNMVQGALKTIGAEWDNPVPFSKSIEHHDVHKTSPSRNPGPIALKKKAKK